MMMTNSARQNQNYKHFASSHLTKILKSTCKTAGYYGISGKNLEYFAALKIDRLKKKYEIDFSNKEDRFFSQMNQITNQIFTNTNERDEFIRQIKQTVIQILTNINNYDKSLNKKEICEFPVKSLTKNGEIFVLEIENNEIYFQIKDKDMRENKKFILFRFDAKFSFDNLKERIKYTLDNPDLAFKLKPLDKNLHDTKWILGSISLGILVATFVYYNTSSYLKAGHGLILGHALGRITGLLLKFYITNQSNTTLSSSTVDTFKNWLIETQKIPYLTVRELKEIIGGANISNDSFTTKDGKTIINLQTIINYSQLKKNNILNNNQQLENDILKDEDKIVFIPRNPKRLDKSRNDMERARNYDISTIDELILTLIGKPQDNNQPPSSELDYIFKISLEDIYLTDIMSFNQLSKLKNSNNSKNFDSLAKLKIA